LFYCSEWNAEQLEQQANRKGDYRDCFVNFPFDRWKEKRLAALCERQWQGHANQHTSSRRNDFMGDIDE